MTTIKDYFLPAYIEQALRQAGLFKVIFEPFLPEEHIDIEHLELTPSALRLAAQLLRSRRSALSRQAQSANRLAGLEHLLTTLRRLDSPIRQEAMQILPVISGFSPEMITLLLDTFVGLFTGETLTELPPHISTRLASAGFIETPNGYARFYPSPSAWIRRLLPDGRGPIRRSAPPGLVSSIAAGNVPGASIMQAFFPLMIGSACIGKNSSDEPYFGPRFLAALAAFERAENIFPLSDLVVLLTFPGERRPLIEELIHQGDHLIITGGHDTKGVIQGMLSRMRLRGRRDLLRRVSGHWHKVSFDVVSQEYLDPAWLGRAAFNVAFDSSMYNTQGCLSCQQVFIEGDQDQMMGFAVQLIEYMKMILSVLPKGAKPYEGLRQMYNRYENLPGVDILTNLGDLVEIPIFVACDDHPERFGIYNACNRSVVVRRVDSLENDLPRLLQDVPVDLLQSCGAAVPASRLEKIAGLLGQAGVNRIVAAGDIWNMAPGLESWDGYLPPLDLLYTYSGWWTTIKFHDPDQALRDTYSRNLSLLDTIAPIPVQIPALKFASRRRSSSQDEAG